MVFYISLKQNYENLVKVQTVPIFNCLKIQNNIIHLFYIYGYILKGISYIFLIRLLFFYNYRCVRSTTILINVTRQRFLTAQWGCQLIMATTVLPSSARHAQVKQAYRSNYPAAAAASQGLYRISTRWWVVRAVHA